MVSMRSTNRSPRPLWLPKQPLRQSTARRSARSAALFVGSTPEAAQTGPEGREPAHEPVPVEFAPRERLPGVEDALALRKQRPAGEMDGRTAPECEPLEVAHPVRPAELPTRARLVRAPAVTGHDARVVGAHEPVEVASTSTSAQVEERGPGGCRRPDPAG